MPFTPPKNLPGYSNTGPWFYNRLNGAYEFEQGIAGFIDTVRVETIPFWYGFRTQQDMVNAAQQMGWPTPTQHPTLNPLNTSLNPLKGKGFGAFFEQPNLWARLGEAIVGGGLVLIGIAGFIKGRT
jgi:hypothetical protein